jgi:hypothetical protein
VITSSNDFLISFYLTIWPPHESSSVSLKVNMSSSSRQGLPCTASLLIEFAITFATSFPTLSILSLSLFTISASLCARGPLLDTSGLLLGISGPSLGPAGPLMGTSDPSSGTSSPLLGTFGPSLGISLAAHPPVVASALAALDIDTGKSAKKASERILSVAAGGRKVYKSPPTAVHTPGQHLNEKHIILFVFNDQVMVTMMMMRMITSLFGQLDDDDNKPIRATR